MKKLMIVAALASLSACNNAPEDDGMTEDAVEVVEVAPVSMAADGMPAAGSYAVTNSEGAVSNEVLAEDGTFTSTKADGTVETGTWEQKTPNEFCVTMSTEGAVQECYEEAVDENGVWTSFDPSDQTTSTVVRTN